MDMENLVKMANQIGDFYASYPNQVEASQEIANHLKKFWAPRMRSSTGSRLERYSSLVDIDAQGHLAAVSEIDPGG